MKMIIAVVQPAKLETIREALAKLEVARMTVTDGQGYGRQKGRTELFRGVEYGADLLRKVVLEIVVNDDFLERTVETLRAAALTGTEGSFGDGKIFIVPVHDAIQIESDVRGPEAV